MLFCVQSLLVLLGLGSRAEERSRNVDLLFESGCKHRALKFRLHPCWWPREHENWKSEEGQGKGGAERRNPTQNSWTVERCSLEPNSSFPNHKTIQLKRTSEAKQHQILITVARKQMNQIFTVFLFSLACVFYGHLWLQSWVYLRDQLVKWTWSTHKDTNVDTVKSNSSSGGLH